MSKKQTLAQKLLNLYADTLTSAAGRELANFMPVSLDGAEAIIEVLDTRSGATNLSALPTVADELMLDLIINTDFSSAAYKIYCQKILPILAKLYPNLAQNSQNKLLQILGMMNIPESLQMFVALVIAPSCDDNYDIYRSLKMLTDIDAEYVNILFPALGKVLAYKDFRAVGVVELANQLYSDKKLKNHPLANDLSIIKEWLSSSDFTKFSYAVTGCATLSLIDDDESKKLLNLALDHPGIEVRLEAVFSQIILGSQKAEEQLTQFCLDLTISYLAFLYAEELGLDKQIWQKYQHVFRDLDFTILSGMSNWLRREREYGRPPTTIEIWDKKLSINGFKYYYPEADDFSKLMLKRIGYAYLGKDDQYQFYNNGKIYQTPKEAYKDYSFEFKTN